MRGAGHLLRALSGDAWGWRGGEGESRVKRGGAVEEGSNWC